MKNHDLEKLCNVINLGRKCSFLLKDVVVRRVQRSIASIGTTGAKVRVFIEVDHEGKTTRWDADAVDFQVLDETMTEI